MKFLNYLTEEDKPIEDIFPILRKECGPFLSMMRKTQKVFYRGLFTHESNFFFRNQRTEDRKPKNTPKLIHDKLNELFKKEFGWNVRNGVFCTQDSVISTTYGVPYIIFGVGDFQYCWSPFVQDLFLHINTLPFKYSNELTEKDIAKLYLIVDMYKDTDIHRVPKNIEVSFNFLNGYYALKCTRFDTDIRTTIIRWVLGK